MNRILVFFDFPAIVALAVSLVCCTSVTSCPVSFAQSVVQKVGDHVAATIPLQSQADCAGASRVLNQQSLPGTGTVGVVCYADPSDSPCMSCLEGQCCALIDQACGSDGGASSAAACAGDDGVKGCIVAALAHECAAACGGPS